LNSEDAISRLHENERKVLLALEGRGTATTQELSSETGLGRDAVEKASAWAETKGVVSFREEVSRSFNLTEEGQTYIDDGLPEKRLLEFVAEGRNEISALKNVFPSLNIALVWVRRNGWATIEKGKLNLTDKGLNVQNMDTPDERILRDVRDESVQESPSDEYRMRLDLLIRRNTINDIEETKRWVEITEAGEALIPALKKVRETLVITQITP
jgi:phenylalanyl-tRNA synthetase alpha chain